MNATEEFNRGEVKAHLENIKGDVSDIKQEMKEHNISDKVEFSRLNDKIDNVSLATRLAADKAETVSSRLKEQEGINEARHQETRNNLESIRATVEKLAKDQTDTKAKVTKIYTIAGVFGGITGVAVPRLVDYIIGKF